MKQELIKQIEGKFVQKHPDFGVGDTIAVSTVVREGDKKRNQLFKGIVIAIKGAGIGKTFTIRKISAGVGVEKILPFNSPNVGTIKIIKKGAVRKSKIYYMRKRIGKKALKVNEGIMTPEEDEVEIVAEVAEAAKSDATKTETAAVAE